MSRAEPEARIARLLDRAAWQHARANLAVTLGYPGTVPIAEAGRARALRVALALDPFLTAPAWWDPERVALLPLALHTTAQAHQGRPALPSPLP